MLGDYGHYGHPVMTFRRRIPAVGALLCVVLLFGAPAAQAATTYTRVSLTANVTGTSVAFAGSVKASGASRVYRYTISVTDASTGAWVAAGASRSNVTITTTGTSLTGTATLPPGNYLAATHVGRTKSSAWTRVGPWLPFTVSSTSTTSPPTAPGQVVFVDEFTGAAGAYDHAKWGEWSASTYNGSAAYGRIKPGDRSTLDGQGHLRIPATPDTGTSISTKDHFRFTYGTITARIKVQTESGYWPAFWTLNSNPDGTNTSLVGEADVIEAYTKYNDGYRSASHNYSYGTDNGPLQNPLCGGGNIRGVYHDYSARIEPGKITFLFDGAVCWSYTKADLRGKPYGFGPDNTAGNWLLLTNAVGNSMHGMEPPTAPSVLLVDRVEVRAV